MWQVDVLSRAKLVCSTWLGDTLLGSVLWISDAMEKPGLSRRASFSGPVGSWKAGSAEIRGFSLVFGIIGAQWWRVSDAAKQNLRNFCREIFLKCGFFQKFVWCPWFRTIFLHRMAFLRKFSGAPVWGLRANLSQIGVFWGVLFFCFGLILLAAYLHDGWWRGCTWTTRRKNKKKEPNSNQWQQLLV